MKHLYIILIVAITFCETAWADDAKSPTPAPAPANSTNSANKTIALGTKVLPLPPKKPGCYQHNTDWQEVPCLSQEEMSHIQPPYGVILQQIGASRTPIPGAELAVEIVQLGSEEDSKLGANAFSLQLNTNQFIGNNGHTDWVQFVYQKAPQYDVACIWPIDLTNGDYLTYRQCTGVSSTRNIQKGDTPTLSGTVDGDTLYMIAYLPWATNDTNDAVSVVASNVYALGSSAVWSTVDGGLLGTAQSSTANFTSSCATTTLKFYYPNQNVPPAGPPVAASLGGFTKESNNFNLVNVPVGACENLTCSASYHGVSQDYTKGQAICYPQDTPIPPLPPGPAQTAFEDDNSQITMNGTKVHVCPGASLLIGVDAGNNRFLCSNSFLLPPVQAWDPPIADTGTVEIFSYGGAQHGVRVCPTDSAMVGWNQDKDWLICRALPPSGFVPVSGFTSIKVDGPGGTQVPEPDHSGQSMHACDAKGENGPLAMRGIQSADNVLICMNSVVTPRLQ